ncbi:MAG: HNH endonuclease [Actinomycetota bacterium]|nr:HNH endonuclease [Actinomycetota bacterium]
MLNPYGLDDDCTIVPYVGIPGVCNRCGEKLTGRKTQWCSAECSDKLTREHNWNWARKAARRRDENRCVRCGEAPLTRRRVERLDPTIWWGAHRLKTIGVEIDDPLPDLLVDVYNWVIHLEVNHITPRNGGGYGWGCHNHLNNLETLCHGCHVAETNRQAAERRVPSAQLQLEIDNQEAHCGA